MKINHYYISSQRASSQKGQSFIIIMMFVGLFLLAMVGVASDYSQVWAHRQMAQAAADAACQAGAADLYLDAIDPSAPGTGGIGSFSWIAKAGTGSFTCSSNSGSPPCVYASLNGYSGSNVAVSFPTSLPNVNPLPSAFGTVNTPYIQVTITDQVPMTFTRMVSSNNTVSISAKAGCGVLPVAVPVPLVILHKTASASLSLSGSPVIDVFGGPQRSIEVDSDSPTAFGAGGTVNLSQGGPNNTGSDFGVFGGATANPGNVSLGTSGHYLSPASPIGDPFITVSEPSEPGTKGTVQAVPLGVNGCPDPNGCVEFTPGDYTGCTASGNVPPGGQGCLLLPYTGSDPKFKVAGNDWVGGTSYTAGQIIQPSKNNSNSYLFIATNSGKSGTTEPNPWNQTPCARQSNATCSGGTTPDGSITWQNVGAVALNKLSTGIFDPGLYYVDANGLNFGAGSTARVSAATGDGSRGVMFYFNSTGTIGVTSNSGKSSACTSASNTGTASPSGCVVAYNITGAISSQATGYIPSPTLQCPSGSAPPAIVPNTLNGNILIGPCGGNVGGISTTYGSPDGNRGFLFFQNRSESVSASWGGGGQFLSSGFMYFTSGNGASCGKGTSCLSLQGGSGAASYTLGNIVVDELSMGGNPQINMILNPAATFQVLKPSLLE